MYNVDKYFDFDSEKKAETKSKKKKKQQQQMILFLLLVAGIAYYYFMVYLPEEEIKKLETKLQAELDRVKNAKSDDVAEIKISNILVGRYNEDAKLFPDGDKHEDFHFSRAASYDIHFPPSMEEFFKLGKEKNKKNCYLLDKNEDLI
ncbi:15691_t:CDS:2 [Funneliformis geosporum]|uniref:15691_t:CDS:1 n=1 Tax=Funneliformis geosporum TaxID=1117311 RepID=A0A9W4SR23_9GLOM|nr:15691_t:CDS:2 [Funneliformis geosporum]